MDCMHAVSLINACTCLIINAVARDPASGPGWQD